MRVLSRAAALAAVLFTLLTLGLIGAGPALASGDCPTDQICGGDMPQDSTPVPHPTVHQPTAKPAPHQSAPQLSRIHHHSTTRPRPHRPTGRPSRHPATATHHTPVPHEVTRPHQNHHTPVSHEVVRTPKGHHLTTAPKKTRKPSAKRGNVCTAGTPAGKRTPLVTGAPVTGTPTATTRGSSARPVAGGLLSSCRSDWATWVLLLLGACGGCVALALVQSLIRARRRRITTP